MSGRSSAVAIAMLMLSGSARAGDCGGARPWLYPEPSSESAHAETVVPTNVQLRLHLPLPTEEVELSEESSGITQSRGVADRRTAELFLRDERGTTISLNRTSVAAPTGASFVLVPRQALAPSTRYTVMMRGTEVEGPSPRTAHDYPLGQYTSGTGPDDQGPSFTAIGARFVRPVFSRQRRSKGEAFGPHVVVRIGPPSDPGEPLLFEITPLAGAAAHIWKRGFSGDELAFGAVGGCHSVDYVFPQKGRLRFELRAVDMAGNTSEPRTIEVNLDRAVSR